MAAVRTLCSLSKREADPWFRSPGVGFDPNLYGRQKIIDGYQSIISRGINLLVEPQ